jgi:hypothetical protein
MAHSATISLSNNYYTPLVGTAPFILAIDPQNIVSSQKIYKINYDFGDGQKENQSLYIGVNDPTEGDPKKFIKIHEYFLLDSYQKNILASVSAYQMGATQPIVFNIDISLNAPTLEAFTDDRYFGEVHLSKTRMFGTDNTLLYNFETSNPHYIIPTIVNWKLRPVEKVKEIIIPENRPYRVLEPYENEMITSIDWGSHVNTIQDTPAPDGIIDPGSPEVRAI